ncbi:4-carboxy-4-hydroxy-2-oxoadipate aldolase/oxaloacetate decarboxylase [Microbacterium azadirachtae]|uniref:Putative 4-hydroxy-4-methyl-2-oxoglutarate aldolase n=1 Tax=Microbacterium azadirachtae TaxID=582680 RepID=A0A0F0L306_9MICO|nr:4-carboxy-4-hydroxy-2-oxoadipate aldolase/oxaloacetate decarboxylase [Microbacterium azadirachtae]KJL27084.1 4-carboxy-4-hydroxy-2-oxoadipic acid aldolase [Microbacterium azadirachtae]UXW85407.1 4-carboxy-4-hydroxy-2-oxoadipate aldolase/oxaloacetate decarboxylase [Microbacterium azadirachtae]
MSGADPIDAAELLRLGSATLYEASGQDCFLDAAFRPAWDGAEIVGRAVPVAAQAGDNLALHHGLEAAGPGDVLVVDGGGAPFGYWGEVMAAAAQARGIAGLVIDGGVRDTAQLRELGFGAFSTSISIRGTIKQWPGTIGIPITLRGRVVNAGDLVVADRDGVAILPSGDVDRILEAARARAAKEDAYMARLRAGELTLDLYDFRRLGDPIRPAADPNGAR